VCVCVCACVCVYVCVFVCVCVCVFVGMWVPSYLQVSLFTAHLWLGMIKRLVNKSL